MTTRPVSLTTRPVCTTLSVPAAGHPKFPGQSALLHFARLSHFAALCFILLAILTTLIYPLLHHTFLTLLHLPYHSHFASLFLPLSLCSTLFTSLTLLDYSSLSLCSIFNWITVPVFI